MAQRNQGESAAPRGAVVERNEDRAEKNTLVIIAGDRFGKGDDELGRGLVLNFVRTLKEMKDEVQRLVLVNGGVKLAVEGSEVLKDLQEYEREGLGILVCGKCLETFNLADKNRVGERANMLDIVTSMQVAEKVITFS